MFNTLSPPCLRPRYTNIYPPPLPRCKGGFQPQETLSKSLPPVDKGLKVGTGGVYLDQVLDQVVPERASSTLAYKGEAPKPEPVVCEEGLGGGEGGQGLQPQGGRH